MSVALKLNFINRYFTWLQLDTPTGVVESYPLIDENNETSRKGVFIVGDLTGIPLLKLASSSGAKIVEQFQANDAFQKERDKHKDVLAVAIVGGGPAGISAALACEEKGLSYKVLEANKAFNTIENFPKGKPIIVDETGPQPKAALRIINGTKESLLEDLEQQIQGKNLQIQTDTFIKKIDRQGDILVLETSAGEIQALRVVLAIGKTGNARQLAVPGEDLPKVFNKLYDPGEFQNKKILVVGGGDSALETSIALAKTGNQITHSYRKESFARPKENNLKEFNDLVEQGKITPLFGSTVKAIQASNVIMKTPAGENSIPNDVVFSMIGRELPLEFFKRSGIKMEGEKDFSSWVYATALISFSVMLYFGKSGCAIDIFAKTKGIADRVVAYLEAPFRVSLQWDLAGYKWFTALNFYVGWLGSIVFLLSGAIALVCIIKNRDKYFGGIWPIIKYSYFAAAAITLTYIYFSNTLSKNGSWIEEPTYWYSLLYCTTMALFAIRRSYVRRTRYVYIQMATLVFIQVFFLFLLPFHLYKPLIENPLGKDHWIIKEIFPSKGYSSFALILFWPLNMWEFGKTTFWTWFPFLQTGLILFLGIYQYGKGVYCGWICSCGGLAETLGDEYREKAPHGPLAKKLENIGQGVLIFAIVTTAVVMLSKWGVFGQGNLLADTMTGLYKMAIDVIFAGVLGLGVYFFLGGRIWCRMGCPLAALMHIYNRFSRYRIFSEKKKCISCNICTKVCHMGIDVMNYANKGIPMNDTECVRCSACVTSCPMDVLAFGKAEGLDTHNHGRKEIPEFGKKDWRAGIQ